MKAPSSQLGSAALALGARVAGGAAVAAMNTANSTATTPTASQITGSTVDIASVVVGGALALKGKQWGKFGMWLAIIGGVDYLSPVIAPTITQAAPQLQGKVV